MCSCPQWLSGDDFNSKDATRSASCVCVFLMQLNAKKKSCSFASGLQLLVLSSYLWVTYLTYLFLLFFLLSRQKRLVRFAKNQRTSNFQLSPPMGTQSTRSNKAKQADRSKDISNRSHCCTTLWVLHMITILAVWSTWIIPISFWAYTEHRSWKRDRASYRRSCMNGVFLWTYTTFSCNKSFHKRI